MAALPFSSDTDPSYRRTPVPPESADVLGPWLALAETRSLAHVRGPVVQAAQRLGLASMRTAELQEHVEELRNRRLNVPIGFTSADVDRLETRIFALEKVLHDERVALWRDLLPLVESARDAGVERQRQAWLAELARVLGGGPAP